MIKNQDDRLCFRTNFSVRALLDRNGLPPDQFMVLDPGVAGTALDLLTRRLGSPVDDVHLSLTLGFEPTTATATATL
jgi:hypothetical protein